MNPARPSKEDIIQAHDRIRPFIHRTPVLTCETLDRHLSSHLFFKCENFQKAGAFKYRGATNSVQSLPPEQLKHGVATHSSGNHAQALAKAAGVKGIPAYVVMPSNSSKVKVEAVKNYGAEITFCVPTLQAREDTLKQVIAKTGATEVHPYDRLPTICGQATAAKELMEDIPGLDMIIAPVGGGGLLSGTALSAHYFSPATGVLAAEPAKAADAFESFTRKTFIPSVAPDTIADGLRTSLGNLTFPIILEHVTNIILVGEEEIIAAMRLVWERMKIIIETSSATAVAAVLKNMDMVRNKRVGIIVSGGNVDLDSLPWIIK